MVTFLLSLLLDGFLGPRSSCSCYSQELGSVQVVPELALTRSMASRRLIVAYSLQAQHMMNLTLRLGLVLLRGEGTLCTHRSSAFPGDLLSHISMSCKLVTLYHVLATGSVTQTG